MRYWRLLITSCLVATLGTVLDMQPTQAQFSTQLPSVTANDFGNGAATSDVAGGGLINPDENLPTPAVTHGTPTAYGANWGDLFMAAGMQWSLREARGQQTGSMFGGLGVGHAERTVGLELTAANHAIVGNTLANRSLSIKLHRRVVLQDLAIAVGMENLWIGGSLDGGRSIYSVVSYTHRFRASSQPVSSLTVTLGIGDGRFNPESNVRAGRNAASPFGSVSMRLAAPMSVFATWNGQNLNLGLSVAAAPIADIPLTFTPVALDLTRSAGNGPRLAMAGGLMLQL